jgi:hypothetical protein
MIALCSAFRDAEQSIWEYFAAAGELRRRLAGAGDRLHLVIGDGDSIDRTSALLLRYAAEFEHTIVDCSHGGRKYGSVINRDRFRRLAYVGNRMLDNVPTDTDAIVMLDGDLIWDADTILALVGRLAEVPACAPLVLCAGNPAGYAGDGPFFYDIWAFRRNGMKFTPLPPYHPDLGKGLLQLESAGGCLAIRGNLARKVRFGDADAIVGLCGDIYQHGGTVWVDAGLSVRHK